MKERERERRKLQVFLFLSHTYAWRNTLRNKDFTGFSDDFTIGITFTSWSKMKNLMRMVVRNPSIHNEIIK